MSSPSTPPTTLLQHARMTGQLLLGETDLGNQRPVKRQKRAADRCRRMGWLPGRWGVDIRYIYATEFAFAALKADASVVSWGGMQGRQGLESITPFFQRVQAQLAVDVWYFYDTAGAFAALKADGSVVAWGWDQGGGDCSSIQRQLVDVSHS